MASEFDLNTQVSIFKRMLLMRYFEEAVIRLHQEKAFSAHYHVYIGQEATGAAVLEALTDDDIISTTHRNHGHIVGRGADVGRAMAEILGRVDGLNKARGGTLHLTDRSRGFLSTSAVVGSCAGLAAGGAYGLKSLGKSGVSVAFFGDGSLEEGVVIETFNIAALWKLPLIYICENNSPGALGQQAGGYPSAVTAASKLGQIPAAFGIETHLVDGTDAAAVWDVVMKARRQCLNGQGPVFIETVTTRWPGSNPLWPEMATETDLRGAWDETRIEGPHADWLRQSDPIIRMAKHLSSETGVPQDSLMATDQEVRSAVSEAVDFALGSGFPEPETASEDAID